MRGWKLLAVTLWSAVAFTARAQSAQVPQVVVVPPPPAAAAPDGGAPQVVVVPVTPNVPLAQTGDGGAPVASGPGEPDAGASEGEVQLLLIPAKPPPPPEAPRQIKVTVMHQPRPRVEWAQAGLELGISSGVYALGAGGLFVAELIPIFIIQSFFSVPAANTLLGFFAVGNALVLPLATTIAIDRTKAQSAHYQLEGWGWWATYGTGVLWQAIAAIYTIAALDVNHYIAAPPLLVFGALTPLSQTVVANALATPRDPLAPLEGMTLAPVLLDGHGRPIPIVTVVRVSF